MSHYEARLQADLDEIKHRLGAVGEAVRAAVDGVMQALAANDIDRLHAVALGDLPINREVRAIDGLCHAFIARHLPAAHHLRFVSSAMRISVALERLGDYAVAIGRIGARMTTPIRHDRIEILLSVTLDSTLMLEQATRAFLTEDAGLAEDTKALANRVDRKIEGLFDQVFDAAGDARLHHGFSILSIASRLERVSDQAKNVCEEAVFIATGQTKPPKRYRILFVDGRNDLVGPLAMAIAEHAFPNSGAFRTQGLAPAEASSPALARASNLLRLDIQGVPTGLGPMGVAPPEHHVIVLLEGAGHDVLPEVPFATVVVRWAVGADLPAQPDDDALQALARDLSTEIAALMETMRGPDAD